MCFLFCLVFNRCVFWDSFKLLNPLKELRKFYTPKTQKKYHHWKQRGMTLHRSTLVINKGRDWASITGYCASFFIYLTIILQCLPPPPKNTGNKWQSLMLYLGESIRMYSDTKSGWQLNPSVCPHWHQPLRFTFVPSFILWFWNQFLDHIKVGWIVGNRLM